MSTGTCLAPHLFDGGEPRNFLGRNPPNHMDIVNQKARARETEGHRGCNRRMRTRFRGSAISLCAAPWLTWPRLAHGLAHLRVGCAMRSGSGLPNWLMDLRGPGPGFLKIPCPQDIAPLRAAFAILMALPSQTDFPDIAPTSTVRSTRL